ncbi:tRNA uridine-5-carboxymethylaminomethyl(34) synthesis GTPase MnmE [Gemmobacter serpentinus]|uniref:tRNA uridine-5-carboxymethylaminomethyl(34) synthesis GTPase MnmE n=1 Tax=Gemmobacter serpentinus TaxID=2652247 RepID=UPI00124C5A21|nr:tRNA uridine-5-carboxymethylaminomethyl(34) synthesis GTPase MnmE [Gemmobacter serpentinus]
MDTIFALATARGRAGVSVIRLSGPQAHGIVAQLTGRSLPPLRQAALRKILWQGEVLDEGLVLLFAAGESFTGEDVAELQLHGSTAVTSAVLRVLGEIPGLRLAEAGEFTRRALENSRLDLAQVEGLADLIDAETEAQRKQAFRVLAGDLGRRIDGWRPGLLRAAALLEAVIDFVEEDVPVDVTPEVRQILIGLIAEMKRELQESTLTERVRDGFEVAILGAPNVGKSTLLNTLAGREAAITSEIAGTTRDVIEVRLDLAGLPVTLLDTAGMRETADQIEAIGIARARARGEAADLRIIILGAPEEALPMDLQPEDIVVIGKADLQQGHGYRMISAWTGQGIDALVAEIGQILARRISGSGSLIRERHRLLVTRAVTALESALDELQHGPDRIELVAEDVRRAIRGLDQLIGRVGVEDILGEIFSSFCIGK